MADKYVDRVLNDDFQNHFRDLEVLLLEIKNDESIEFNNMIDVELERLSLLVQIFRSKIDQIDPYIVTPTYMDNWRKYLLQAVTQLESFAAGYHANNHLNNANKSLEMCIPGVLLLSNVSVQQDEATLRETISSLRRSVGQHKHYLEQDVQEARALKVQLDNELHALTEFYEVEEHKLENLYSSKDEELNSLVKEHEKIFDDEKKKWAQDFEREISGYQEQIDGVSNKWDSELEGYHTTHQEVSRAKYDEIQETLDEYKKETEEKQNKLAELYHLVTDGAISGAYHKASTDEGKLRKLWTWLTGAGFALLIGYSAFVFIIMGSGIENWIELVRKILVTGALGAFVTYAAKQASDHRTQERINRDIELKMKSIDPFIDSLPEEVRQEIKKGLVDPLFNQAVKESAATSPVETNPSSAIFSGEQLIELVKNVTSNNNKQ